MPLNPNGKVDKPALPFPDTAKSTRVGKPIDASQLTPTEKKLVEIWSRLLPSPPSPMPLNESFYDLGGHSVLATRLVFEIRNVLAIKAPLGAVFDYPTIKTLAAELDRLGSDDFGLSSSTQPAVIQADSTTEYARDLLQLTQELPARFDQPSTTGPRCVFLTGATGFLGAFILQKLLQRPSSAISKVVCLVRASNDQEASKRLKQLCTERGVWSDEWIAQGRLEAIAGDLDKPSFGLNAQKWSKLERHVDLIVHNGALVSCSRRLDLHVDL
jgi:L-aminoadipate-semialdehyde dehydrogenase